MDRYANQAIVLELLKLMKSASSWCGETHLQKSVFILEYGLSNSSLHYAYIMYKHGPYSFDLHDELSSMISNGMIEVESRNGYGSSLFVSDLGMRILERFPNTVGAQRDDLSMVASRFSAKTATELERIATALFVQTRYKDLDREQQYEKFREFKPYLPEGSAERGFAELEAGLLRAEG